MSVQKLEFVAPVGVVWCDDVSFSARYLPARQLKDE